MVKANMTALANFTDMEMWRLLIPTNTDLLEPHKNLSGARSPTVPNDSEVQVPVKHDFREVFEREQFDGKFVGKGEFIIFVNRLCKLQSHNVF